MGSSRDANKLIEEIIPYKIPLKDDDLDFSLQIVRRYKSSFGDNLNVNFLSRWLVGQILQLQISMPLLQSSSLLSPDKAFYVAQVVMDVNTAPETNNIAGKSVGPILREMRGKIDAVRRGEGVG